MNPIKLAHARHIANATLSGQQTYAQWRAKIPWSDDQIADAIERWGRESGKDFLRARAENWAAYVRRTGRISGKVMGIVTSYLVTTCEFCDRTALYREGVKGRCRKHRHIIGVHRAAAIIAGNIRATEQSDDYHAMQAGRDSSAKHHHATGRK